MDSSGWQRGNRENTWVCLLLRADSCIYNLRLEHLVERTRSCVQGWCEKKLSCAENEVFIMLAIQSLPTYSMSCFKLTNGLCSKLTTTIIREGMHWRPWEKMIRRECSRG